MRGSLKIVLGGRETTADPRSEGAMNAIREGKEIR